MFKKGRKKTGGRKKGTPNKFARITNDIISLWIEGNGKKRLKKLIEDDENFKEFIIKMVLPLLPKDSEISLDQSQHFTVVWKINDKDRIQPAQKSRFNLAEQEEV